MPMFYVSSPHLCALAGIAAVSALLFKLVIYPTIFSPLSKIPAAHPLASVTSLWIQWQRFRDREFQCISAAFARKGPYVRLGPNEIAINSMEGVLSVYGVGSNNFDKHQSYEYFITHGSRNMFSSLGKDHGFRRRRISAVYARSFVQSSPHVHAILDAVVLQRLLPLLFQAAATEQGSVDILPVLQSYALDFMSSFMFGLSRGTNFLQDECARRHWFDLYIRSYPAGSMFWLLEQPFLTRLLCAVGVPLLPEGHFEAKQEFEAWALDKVKESEKTLAKSEEAGIPLSYGEFPILYSAVRSGIAKDSGIDAGFTPDSSQQLELASECFDHLVATRDTFGTSFTYVLYEISRHQDAQADLRAELLSLPTPFPSSSPATTPSLPPPTALENLPLLNAVIKEGLRLRNNTPGLDPRVTPMGTTRRESSSVGPWGGLPPGVRVGAYSRCLHRDGDAFPDPEAWNPGRWLDGGGGAKASAAAAAAAARDRGFFAFSGGSRGCVGRQVAMELMRFAVAAIYTNFKTAVADESEYPGTDGFVGGDCRERLFIKFERLST